MKKPQIDVLLAAWNGEAYLPQQLDSLQRQLYRDYDVLYQDDGSADGTPALLRETAKKDPRFRAAAEQGRHYGACGNFISLLRQSDAPYCALCDQDDIWAPDHLLALMDTMRKAEEEEPGLPLLVYSDCAVVDEAGKVLHPSMCLHQGWKQSALTLKELLVQNNAAGCTMLLNAPLRKLVTEHAPEKPFMHDWFIALTASAFGGAAYVSMPLVDYRQHGSNVIGASGRSLPARAIHAIGGGRAAARKRVALTYSNTRLFLDACGADLPAPSREAVEAYLATQRLPKLKRVLTVRRKGYRMQNPVFRLGQLFFG